MNVKALFGQDLTHRVRIRENLRCFQTFAPCDKYKLPRRGKFRLNLVEKRRILFQQHFYLRVRLNVYPFLQIHLIIVETLRRVDAYDFHIRRGGQRKSEFPYFTLHAIRA